MLQELKQTIILKSNYTCIQASGGITPQGCGALTETVAAFLSSSAVVIPEETTGRTNFSATPAGVADTIFLEAVVSLQTGLFCISVFPSPSAQVINTVKCL